MCQSQFGTVKQSFFAFPAEIRKVIYTTNAVESLNMSLRKITKTRGSFPNEEAALRLLWLALRNHSKRWSFVQNWREALKRNPCLAEAGANLQIALRAKNDKTAADAVGRAQEFCSFE